MNHHKAFKRSFIIFLVIMMSLFPFPITPAQAKTYTIKDVDESDDAYEIIQDVINQDWMSLTLNRFFPDKKVTRGEFAYILTKFNSQLKEASKIKKDSFKDVSIKDKYGKYIELQKKNITYYKTKNGNYFKPDKYLTREDALVSIVKILGYNSDDATSSGVDSEIDLDDLLADSNKVSSALKNLVTIGVTNELIDLAEDGDDLYLYPKNNITRRQLAMLLKSASDSRGYDTDDGDNISDSDSSSSGSSDDEVTIDDDETTTSNNNSGSSSNTSDSKSDNKGDSDEASSTTTPANTISIDINGTRSTFIGAGTPIGLDGILNIGIYNKDKFSTSKNYFAIDLPDNIEEGDTIVVDNYDSPADIVYVNKVGADYRFGVPDTYIYTSHKSSRMTITITEFNKKKFIVKGTMDGELVLNDGETITFTNGVFYFKGESAKSDF